MTTATPCKPWCTDHKTVGEDSCYTRATIYDNGEEEKEEAPVGNLAAQPEALGGLPKEIAWVNFVASQDEEDEQPLMDLQFFEAGNYEAISTLHLDVSELRQLHANLGDVIRRFA